MKYLISALIVFFAVFVISTGNAYAGDGWRYANPEVTADVNTQAIPPSTAQLSQNSKKPILGVQAPADPVWEGNKDSGPDDSSNASSDDYSSYQSE